MHPEKDGPARRQAARIGIRLRPPALRSGDWDYNPKVAANVLDSVIQYTSIPVYPEEVVIAADSESCPRSHSSS